MCLYFDFRVCGNLNRWLSLHSTFLKKLWWDVIFTGLSSCPVCPLLAIFSFLPKQWEVLEYQKHILAWDPWDLLKRHLVAHHTPLYSSGSHWLHCSEKLTMDTCTQRHILQRDMMHSFEVTMYWKPWRFPQRTHIHITMAKTIPVVCHTKQLQSATRQIKRRDENLVQLESIPSGQHRKTKVSKKHDWLSLSTWLACWTTHKGTHGVDQRWRRPPQEQPGGRRNLLLLSQIYWRDKCSEDESRLYSCDHCLRLVMPHDVRRYLDPTLAYSRAVSPSAVIGWCLYLLAAPYMIAQQITAHGAIESLSVLYVNRQTSQTPLQAWSRCGF